MAQGINIKSTGPGTGVFHFKEIEHPGGGVPRTISFTDVQIKPRGYEELESAKLHQPITIPLEMFNGRVLASDIEEIDLSGYMRIDATLESSFTAQAIGLVRGGWLPSALAATRDNAIVFPDRNIISEISGRFVDGKTIGREGDFLDVFANTPIRINPLLAAMEGNLRAIPTPDEASAQLLEAVEKIKRALPQATLMVGSDSLTGLLGLIQDMRSNFERKRALLKCMSPLLCKPIARRKMDTLWDRVLEEADAHQVPRSSLIVLALLSTLVHPTGRCPAKRLLKLSDRYTDGDAYNALCDIRALELLLHFFAFFPDFETQVCTKDRQLALFWVGIGAHDIAKVGDAIRYSLAPHEAILPKPYGDRWLEAISGK